MFSVVLIVVSVLAVMAFVSSNGQAAELSGEASITIVVTGAVPMPTPAPWCGTPDDPDVHRWFCENGKLVPIHDLWIPIVGTGKGG